MISGLQHFSFCRRQWALIHIEHQWAENYLTTDGALMHENAHNGDYQELRSDTLIIRALRVRSAQLGITGNCDVVEFHSSPDGVPLAGRAGLWLPIPVEYKRGKPGQHTHADKLQLCAQAICLEEMLCCAVPQAALYYGQTRHRESVVLDDALREEVSSLLTEMHQLWQSGHTPKAKPGKGCPSCSMRELCLPRLVRNVSASSYIHNHLEDEE